MFKKRKFFILGIFLILIISQFIDLKRNNSKSEHEIKSSNVKRILKKSCYDCHSNQTKWPLYSRIFPISFFIVKHVEDGREELNFSDWENLSLKKKRKKSNEIVEEIESKSMPPFLYKLFHRDSEVSVEDLEILKKWAYGLEKE